MPTAGSRLLSEPSIEDSIATAFVHTLSQLRNTALVIGISTTPMPEPTIQRPRKQIERVLKPNRPALPLFACTPRPPNPHFCELCSTAFRRTLRLGRACSVVPSQEKVPASRNQADRHACRGRLEVITLSAVRAKPSWQWMCNAGGCNDRIPSEVLLFSFLAASVTGIVLAAAKLLI